MSTTNTNSKTLRARPLYRAVYAIIGRRPNSETLYWVSKTERFVPLGHSLADEFTDRDVAEVTVERLAVKYKGLDVSLERRRIPCV